MWQHSSQISILDHLNDSRGHLYQQLIVSMVRTCDLSIVVRVILHWCLSSVLWSCVKPLFLILHLLEEESHSSWMKQKAVKYHGPINAEVCWQGPPERSAGNAHENNQSEDSLHYLVVLHPCSPNVQWQEQHGGFICCQLTIRSLTVSQSLLVRECLQIYDWSLRWVYPTLFYLRQLIANIFHYLQVYFVAKNKNQIKLG